MPMYQLPLLVMKWTVEYDVITIREIKTWEKLICGKIVNCGPIMLCLKNCDTCTIVIKISLATHLSPRTLNPYTSDMANEVLNWYLCHHFSRWIHWHVIYAPQYTAPSIVDRPKMAGLWITLVVTNARSLGIKRSVLLGHSKAQSRH